MCILENVEAKMLTDIDRHFQNYSYFSNQIGLFRDQLVLLVHIFSIRKQKTIKLTKQLFFADIASYKKKICPRPV